jgi:cytochrome c553
MGLQGATNMKMRLFFIVVTTLSFLAGGVGYNIARSFDGTNPPHAVDTDGRVIPESSATQPCKPIIFSKDIPVDDPKYGELKPEAAFDHTKHNTDVMHTLDGKTLTLCVECHHTEQPSAPSAKPYLKRFDRKEMLTVEQLEKSKEPVRSCRVCHYQKASKPSDEFPPKSVKYPKDIAKVMGQPESGTLTNDTAYHLRCITCHDAATRRDPKLKAPLGCPDCHIKKSATPTPTMTPSTSTTTASTPCPVR